MDAIYPATAFCDHPREVKQAARDRLVRITENGNGAYVFRFEEIFQREVDDAVERALYVQRVSDAHLVLRQTQASEMKRTAQSHLLWAVSLETGRVLCLGLSSLDRCLRSCWRLSSTGQSFARLPSRRYGLDCGRLGQGGGR